MLFDRAVHDVVGAAETCRTPYLHCVFPPDSIVSREEVTALLDHFPEDAMRAPRLRTTGTDKDYFVAHLDVYDRGRWATPLADLPEAWRPFVRYLLSDRYAEAIKCLLELGDAPIDIEIRISRYPRGGWMSRHTDRPNKVFSHNIYLCPGWRPVWGGALALYDSQDAPGAARVVMPGAGNSVAFRRSDDSWHEVLPVTDDAEQPRCAVLVHGYYVVPTATRAPAPVATRSATADSALTSDQEATR